MPCPKVLLSSHWKNETTRVCVCFLCVLITLATPPRLVHCRLLSLSKPCHAHQGHSLVNLAYLLNTLRDFRVSLVDVARIELASNNTNCNFIQAYCEYSAPHLRSTLLRRYPWHLVSRLTRPLRFGCKKGLETNTQI